MCLSGVQFLRPLYCIFFAYYWLYIFIFAKLCLSFLHTERAPDYRFTKKLPKTDREFIGLASKTLECAVNDYRAPIKWYKGDEELPTNKLDKYLFEKDIIGNHKLIIRNLKKKDTAIYNCRIENTKHVTKCSLKVVGNVDMTLKQSVVARSMLAWLYLTHFT